KSALKVSVLPMAPHSPDRARRRTVAVVPQGPPRSRTCAAPRTSTPSDRALSLPLLLLGHYPFVGPFGHWKQLEHRAGILAIVQRSTVGTLPYRVLWLTEAEDVQKALAQLQARGRALSGRGREAIVYAALYTDVVAAARCQIVAELRTRYQLLSFLPTTAPRSLYSAPGARSARRRSLARRG